MSLKKGIYWAVIIILIGYFPFCGRKTIPEEAFQFKPEFKAIFWAISSHDTMNFMNKKGNTRCIIRTEIDSITYNRIGGCNSPLPRKTVKSEYREMYYSKQYDYNLAIRKGPEPPYFKHTYMTGDELHFHFGEVDNKYIDTMPGIYNRKVGFDNKRISNFSIAEGSIYAPADTMNYPVDSFSIQELYFDTLAGIVGFRTVIGELWLRVLDTAVVN